MLAKHILLNSSAEKFKNIYFVVGAKNKFVINMLYADV